MGIINVARLIARGALYKEGTSYDAGFVNDGLRGIDGPDGKKLMRINRGIATSDEAAVFADGNDMAARLNYVCGLSYVKELIIDADQGGDIVINGPVNTQGKTLRFRRGTKFTGTGTLTIDIAQIDAGEFQIFDDTLTLSSTNFKDVYFNPKWLNLTPLSKKGRAGWYLDLSDTTTIQDKGMCLVSQSGKRLKRIVEESISSDWYNPSKDGQAHPLSERYASLPAAQADYPWVSTLTHSIDYAALQSTLNYAINYVKDSKKVVFKAGLYAINKGLNIYRDTNNDGQIEFVNIHLEGEINTMGGGGENETVIKCTHTDNFGLNVQAGKGVTIRNLFFEGANRGLDTYTVADVYGTTKTFVENGCLDTAVAAYTGIGVDLLGGPTTLIGQRYPGFTDKYTTISRGGSSDVKIEGCRMQYFVNGFSLSGNGYTQNGDSIILDRCWIDYCKSAVAGGSSQNRSFWINKLKCWGVTKYVINCGDYGEGTGAFPEVDGIDIAGSVKWLVKGSPFLSQASFTKVYAESLYGIGGNFDNTVNNYNFYDCTFHIQGNASLYARTVATVFRGGSMNFVGGNLYYYGVTPNLFFVDCPRISFIGTKLNLPIMASSEPYYVNVDMNSGYNLTSNNLIAIGTPDGMAGGVLPVLKGQGYEVSGIYGTTDFKRKYIGSSLIAYVGIAPTPITINEGLKTFTFNAGASAGSIMIGDRVVAYGQTNEFGSNIYSFPAGVVEGKAGAVITVGGAGFGLVNGSSYSISIYRQALMSALHIGDITVGNNVITNAFKEGYSAAVALPIGTTIQHPYFPAGTYITGVSGTNISVSNNATSSEVGALIMPTFWQATCNSENPNIAVTGFMKGDIIYNTFVNPAYDSVFLWLCTKHGVIGSAVPPVFKPVVFTTADVVDEYIFTSNNLFTLPANFSLDKVQISSTAALTLDFGPDDDLKLFLDAESIAANKVYQLLPNYVTQVAKNIVISGITSGTVTVKVLKKPLL